MTDLTFSLGNDVRTLLDRAKIIDVIAAQVPDDLRQAFVAAANKTDNALDDFLDEKRDELLQKIPEDARFLVEKVKEFDEQSFELVNFTKSKAGGKAKLAVSAGATILLDRLEPSELQGEVGFSLEDDDALLKLQVSGHVSGSAELKGTAGVLSVGVNFASGTEQSLSYYFAADRTAYVATLVPRIADFIFHPSDLTEVVDKMRESGLLRIERAGEFTTTLGLTVGISQQIKSMLGGLPVQGSLGASLSLEFQDAATFSLVVDRAAAGFVIDFRKTRRKERSRVLKLGVDVRLVGFRNKLIDQIALAIPEDASLKALLERLDGLTERLSEDALRKELEKVLKAKWPKGQSAIAFLVGEQTADDLATEIQAELQQKIAETINAKVDLLNDRADAAARTVATDIADTLGLTGKFRQTLEEYVGEAVEKALTAFNGKLDGAVESLIGEADVAKLLHPWEFVGPAVSDAINALSKNATNVVTRTRDALAKVHERYTRFRQGVLTAVKEKVEEEFSISIISEKDRTLTNTRTISYAFRGADGPAISLYEALWTGDLRNLQELLDAARGSANTISLTGEYVSVATRLSKRTLDVNFFGLKLGSQDLFSDTVEVGIDLNGRLIAARSKAELEERRKLGGESQVINATWQVDYLRNAVLDAPLLLKVVLTDKKFKSGDEVEEFFGPLEQIQAMRTGISTDVETTLFSSTVKVIRDATLTINLMLRWQEWLELVGSDLALQPVPKAWQPDAACRQFLRDAEPLAPAYFSASRQLMARRPEFTELLGFLVAFGSKRFESSARQFVGEPSKGLSALFGTSWLLARAVADLNLGLVALQANWKTLVSKLPHSQAIDENVLDELRPQIQSVNTAFADAFGRVLSTGFAFDDPGKITWLTAATLNLFRSRTDLPNPFLSCAFESEGTGRLLFS